MPQTLFVNIVSTISSEWSPFPHGPNHANVDEVPGIFEPRVKPFTKVVVPTIDIRSYNSDERYTLDVYEISPIDPLPDLATDIRLYLGGRIRTTRHAGRFYVDIGLYNGVDHWYTLSKILDPYQWTPIHSDVIESWSSEEVNTISQIKIKADINPVQVATVYLFVEYVMGAPILYGTGKIYGTGWTYGLNPI